MCVMEKINVYTVKQVKEKTIDYLDDITVNSPEDAYTLFNRVFDLKNKTKEHFVMACLNIKNKVVGLHVIHIGSINMSLVSPRDVFQSALLNNAKGIIIAHNHPSGDPDPSREDIEVTKRLVEAGDMLGIDVLDHIIIGDCYISLRERGRM
ncbi:RadC family protein [Pueribacillus sp. YX66]|uniref:JAB domain-containing protein n=1 Tax=Pueribacillus sp. YX66 TaxID=3229242 RepID=UPI0036D21880